MDVDELLASEVRPQALIKVAGPLVLDLRAGKEVKTPSLDVPALQMVEELGPQAPRWELQVDVPVPLFQETTFLEIPAVQAVERPPLI